MGNNYCKCNLFSIDQSHCRRSLLVLNIHKSMFETSNPIFLQIILKITGFRKYNEIKGKCCFNIGKKVITTSDSFNLIQKIVYCMYFVYLCDFLCIFETGKQVISKPVILKLSTKFQDYRFRIYILCMFKTGKLL